ncbi:MAG TPA: pantetheine-phosphate adenylyltransferase [Candidatus Thalassarchaeaceae archaeon]|jgi:pantetheine-phosphate adenylyltransferase|nr:pantetheine-phosphate adenylyltransferase [Candidatus Thalassarchaeaceae archaeon]|tara:strand:- start:22418 stop:23437 length:1020 start_codon:yes stop_codon:yes gene_type:complete
MHQLGLIGGTFDRFHDGHKSLIRKGLSECNSLEIWITNDSIANAKDNRTKSWSERCSEIQEFLAIDFPRVSFHILEDNHGPAPSHPSASAIVCTAETHKECENINSIRQSNGLAVLSIICAERVLAWDDQPISSSRVRDGQIDRSGHPWIPDRIRTGSWNLSPPAEAELKEPFGRLFSGPEDDPNKAMIDVLKEIQLLDPPRCIISVGDVTVKTLQDVGNPAHIALVDGLTKRQKWDGASEIDRSLYDVIIQCQSPPGTISNSLLRACETAISSWKLDGQTHLIIVEGEEDLAPLILHPLSPIGSVVLYGQPGKGVVLRWCDEESKERCRSLLSAFNPS